MAMELAMELEDDLFFADLSKQISLLIMDDDEELINHSPPLSFEGFSQPFHQAPRMQYLQEHHQQQQQPIYRRECKGTGVFIPRSTNPRKKNKQERCNNNNSKYTTNNSSSKQINNSRSGFSASPQLTQSSSSSSRVSSYYNIEPFNPRRFE